MKLEFIKKGYSLIALSLALIFYQSPIGIAAATAITAPLGAFVNAYPNKKLLNYGYLEQMRDILPSFGLATAMGICIYALSKTIAIPAMLQLIVLTIIGMIFYLLCAKLFKMESFDYIIQTIKEIKNKKGL